MTYGFRLMEVADIDRVRAWRETPHVSAWWDGAIDADDLADRTSRQWIVSHHGEPFAFVQDYDPHAEPNHPFAFLPPGSRGLDQFIGEAAMLGRGHGTRFVAGFVDWLLAEGTPAVGVDPHPNNARAIRAYEKAGFTRGLTCSTSWGDCLLMTRNRE